MPDYVYMGRRLGRARQGVLLDGKVDGGTFDIHTVADTTEPPPFGAQIHDLGIEYDTSSVSLTGGLTRKWGVAENFSGSFEEVPVLFAWDGVSPDLETVRYDLGWFQDHPGVLARVDTLAGGEMRRRSGEMIALTKHDDGRKSPHIYESGEGSLERTATRNTYASEAEMIAYGEDGHRMENPAGSATIVHDGATAPTVTATLQSLGTERWKRRTLSEDPQAAAGFIWDQIGEEIGRYSGGHWVAVVDYGYSSNDTQTGVRDRGEILAVRGPDGQRSIESAPGHLIPKPGETA